LANIIDPDGDEEEDAVGVPEQRVGETVLGAHHQVEHDGRDHHHEMAPTAKNEK
jgi:hypothetical protein